MAKIYYGDENNTAVEINVGGVSGDYLPLNLSANTEVNANGSDLTFSNGDVTFDGNVITNGLMKFSGDRLTISADNAMETATIETSTADLIIDSGSNPITVTGPTTFNNPVTVPTPTANGHAANKQYVDERAIPEGGTAGQVLTKTASGAEWADAVNKQTASSTHYNFIKIGNVVFAIPKPAQLLETPVSVAQQGSVYWGKISIVEYDMIPAEFRPESTFRVAVPGSSSESWGSVDVVFYSGGKITFSGNIFSSTSSTSTFTSRPPLVAWITA